MLRDDLELDEEIVESDLELDNSEVVEPDFDPPEKMGDPSVEVTEENREASQVSKSKAMDAVLEGNLAEAKNNLTEAIILNPKATVLYASRAMIFVGMRKPNAAARDADAALKMDPELARGYKARGMARALLGLWEEAAKDLQVAMKLDFDVETSYVLRKVEKNVQKIEEHRPKYARLRKERELRKIELEKLRLAQEAKLARLLKDGKVIRIKSANELQTKLDAASQLSHLAIVYFTARWCGPCRYVAPVYASLAAKYPKVAFLKVDIDEERIAAAEWNVSSIPSFYLLKNGTVVDREVNIDMNSLEKKITQHA